MSVEAGVGVDVVASDMSAWVGWSTEFLDGSGTSRCSNKSGIKEKYRNLKSPPHRNFTRKNLHANVLNCQWKSPKLCLLSDFDQIVN